MVPLILRVPQHALRRLDQRVHMARVRGPDGNRDATEQPGGQAVLEPLPRQATVLGAIDAARRSARHQLPRMAHELPHGGEQQARITRHHDEIGDAGRVVDEQHLVPRLAAVRRAKHAALRIGRPHVAQRRHEHHVGIGRIDHDAADLPHVAETHELPALARVGRHEDAAAIHHIVARIAFARPHPHDVRVRRSQGERTDRRRRLVFEHRLPRVAAVRRLPHAAGGGPDVIRVPVTGHSDHRRDATTAHRWPQIAELHVVERVGSHGHGHGRGRGWGDGSLFRPATTLRGRGQSECHRYEQAAETGWTESRAMHRTNSFGGL